jgi:hypothetical protein
MLKISVCVLTLHLFVVRILKKGDELIYKEDWLSQQDGGLDQTFDMTGTLKPFSN